MWDEGREVSLGGPKPRALLAVLFLHPNQVLSADRLIDELWGEDSPERAHAALPVNVSRLRKALPRDVLATRSPGYVVRVGPDELDLHRFERLVDEARSLRARGLAAAAAKQLGDALSQWKGPPLADFAYEDFAEAAIARLEEIRLAAVELRIDIDPALGRHDELVGELEAPAGVRDLVERSILVAITDETCFDALRAVAQPLVLHPPRVRFLARLVPTQQSFSPRQRGSKSAGRRLAGAGRDRCGLVHRRHTVRTWLGSQPSSTSTSCLSRPPDELLSENAPDEQLTALLSDTPCDVALLVPRGAMDTTPDRPVFVPFGAADHDWAAVELGAWLARVKQVPLRLAGAAAVPEHGRRNASRLLSHGALAVQRVLGISAEPLLTPSGEEGMLEASRDAVLLVVGLSTRWHREGLGSARLRLARAATIKTTADGRRSSFRTR